MKKVIGAAVVGMLAVSAQVAQGLTTNVSDVAELAKVLAYMNTNYHNAASTLILKKGHYDVTGLNLPYWNNSEKKVVDSLSNFGVSYFTMRGETDDPRDVVIYRSDASSSLRLMYSYSATVRNLTLSNGVTSAQHSIGNVNGNSIYSNVVVTCCSAASCGAANSGTWIDCQFIGNTAGTYGGGLYGAKAYGCTFEGNSAPNGAAAYAVVLSNCTIRANTATTGGGGIYDCTATNCLIIGNSAQKGGGCCGGYSASRALFLVGCTVTNNTATTDGGGVYATAAGRVTIEGGLVVDNTAAQNGGGLYKCSATGCEVRANTARGSGGGTYDSVLDGCLVACNTATNMGGGCYGSERAKSMIGANSVISNNVCGGGGAGVFKSTVADSRICMNFMDGSSVNGGDYSCGGGVYDCFVTNSTIDGNAVILGTAKKNTVGGGAYSSDLKDCLICNNYVDALGGGMANGTASGCIVSNNICKGTGGSNGVRSLTNMVNCDIYEDTVDPQGPVLNCRFMNYTNGNVVAEGANVYTNGYFAGAAQLVKSYGWFTNCLFAGNHVSTLITHSGKFHSVFSGCTFADNWYKNATVGFQGPTNTLTLINCILARNKNQSGKADLNFNPTFAYMALTNCVIGSFDSDVELAYPMSNIITNNNPRFVDDGSRDPYALSYGSPARQRGLVQDWMTGTLDIRHDPAFPRLRDGKVDIGCYACWLDPKGLSVTIR